MTVRPLLTLQTGTLYASGYTSTFTGTGGPWGWSPFTSQFGGVVSSAGLDGEPFADTVFNVAAGDEVTFVVAVQNRTAGASAFDVHLQATMPAGFVIPADGMNVTVTDGTGTDLPLSGNLFTAGGLSIGTPLAGYDPNSGLNVAVLTYTLQAGPSLPAVNASVLSTASIVHEAATAGGADLSASNPVSASTTVVTAAPLPVVQAETDPSAVATGQNVSFDVSVAVPNGTVQDLQLQTVLPSGPSNLTLVSASVTSVGSGLHVGTPAITANGTISFGAVTNTGTGTTEADDSLTAKVVVKAAGTASGPATLQTVLSAADPNSPGGRWSATVNSSVGVVAPPTPPQISGTLTGQHGTTASILYPFAGLGLSSSQADQTGTLAITLQDGSLGRLGGTALGSFDATGGSFVASGTMAALQAAARQIVFKPGVAGTEHFTVTLVDSQGGTAQDGSTTTLVSAPVSQQPAPQPTAPALIAAPTAQQSVSNSSGTVAIVTSATTGATPSFITNAAAQLAAAPTGTVGSNTLIGGTGTQAFFLKAPSSGTASQTIVGFHAGDVLTVFGYVPGTSTYAWTGVTGAAGYQGSTLQINVAGPGHVSESITFTGATAASASLYSIHASQTAGGNALIISA